MLIVSRATTIQIAHPPAPAMEAANIAYIRVDRSTLVPEIPASEPPPTEHLPFDRSSGFVVLNRLGGDLPGIRGCQKLEDFRPPRSVGVEGQCVNGFWAPIQGPAAFRVSRLTDDEVDRGKMFVVALGVARLDPDQVYTRARQS